MRTRVLTLVALLALPSLAAAQSLPRPRIGRGGVPAAAPLPPEAPVVSRALAYHRSRWSAEGYTLLTNFQTPTEGGTESSTSLGTGTHADYRFNDNLALGVDMTAGFMGGSAVTETAELGVRYRPMPWNENVRPFVDARAAYLHMYDSYFLPSAGAVPLGGPALDFAEQGRYSHGIGAVGGAGFEYSLTQSLSFTNELSVFRARQTTYRVTGPTAFGDRATFWTTAYRYTFGLKYNATRALHLAQNPR